MTDVGIGVAVAVVASVINLVVARMLIGAGRQHRSIDAGGRRPPPDDRRVDLGRGGRGRCAGGRHRLGASWIPLIALVVAANIVVTGVSLVRRLDRRLMDRALTAEELAPRSHAVLKRYATAGRAVPRPAHPPRRPAARSSRCTSSCPATGRCSAATTSWSTSNATCARRSAHATVFTHLEPLEDPVSFADTGLDRSAQPARG